MRNKLLKICVVIFILTFVLTGCAKCTSTETSIVQVKITDKYYRAQHTTIIPTGKSTVIIPHSAVYKITVEYNGTEYNVYGNDTYNKYSDKIGEYTNAVLETKKYDNDTVKYNITELE